LDDYEDFRGFCDGCILPINNGKEVGGESLVIDFESTHFVGTLLLRIKNVLPVEKEENSESKKKESNDVEDNQCNGNDYFTNKKRKFQAIIKGRFKTPFFMSRCVTGQTFERPAGKLPARWLVRSIIKFISILAPQLDASLDGEAPILKPVISDDPNCFV